MPSALAKIDAIARERHFFTTNPRLDVGAKHQERHMRVIRIRRTVRGARGSLRIAFEPVRFENKADIAGPTGMICLAHPPADRVIAIEFSLQVRRA